MVLFSNSGTVQSAQKACLFHGWCILSIELEQLQQRHSLAAVVRVVDLQRVHAVQGHEGCPPQLVPIENLHNARGHSVIVHHNLEELVATSDLNSCVQVGLATQQLQKNAVNASALQELVVLTMLFAVHFAQPISGSCQLKVSK